MKSKASWISLSERCLIDHEISDCLALDIKIKQSRGVIDDSRYVCPMERTEKIEDMNRTSEPGH